MESKFKVIIVGGSISGLTLAHCLDRADIEYLVLERNDHVSPQVGASIGIMPNGARILDQLGLFDGVEEEIEPLDRSHICYPDGFSFTSSYPTLLSERFGYPVAFVGRQRLLDILYSGLNDKSKVHLGKKVVKVKQLKTALRVFTRDGCFYDGDLVVGADGVHSKVRSEMWKIADTLCPGLITSREKKAMNAEYACVYGISGPVPGLIVGEQIACFDNGKSILTIHGKGGRVFWFVLKKMDKRYYYPNVPRFDPLHAEIFCQGLKTNKVWGRVTFGQIWATRETYTMTVLQENVFQHWNFGRIVCFGDSMHPMTPNLGQGANSAIEGAAALANTLHDMINIHNIHQPSSSEIDTRLNSFTKLRRERTLRVAKTAGFLTRMQARDGLLNRLIGRYFAPYAGDLPADMCYKVMQGATKLDYIPLPERSKKGWLLVHQDVGVDRALSLIRSILDVLVFFLVAAIAIRVLGACRE